MIFAHPPLPRAPALTVDTPLPARFLADQLRRSLLQGDYGRGRLAAATRRFAAALLADGDAALFLLRTPRRRARDDIDALLVEVARRWPDLRSNAHSLPTLPERFGALAVERSVGLTLFVFGSARHPLVVVKAPRGASPGTQREVEALRRLHATRVAPRHLGSIGDATVQEGLRGSPLVPQLSGTASAWPPAGVIEALADVARVTVESRPPRDDIPPMAVGLEESALSAGTRERARRAVERVSASPFAVLRHGDLSPQNVLVDPVGLVDWEMAHHDGVPGFDVLHAAVSHLEAVVARGGRSPRRLLERFAREWRGGFGDVVRAGVETSRRAAGVEDVPVDDTVIAFFTRRLGRRRADPQRYAIGRRVATAMLESVCAS